MTINLANLAAKYPVEYAAIFNAGRAEGVAAENDRCQGLLTAARLSGAMELAHAAIADGRCVAELSAQFLEAGLRRRDIRDRQEDDAEAEAALSGVGHGSAAGADMGDAVADIVLAGERDGSDFRIRPTPSTAGGRLL